MFLKQWMARWRYRTGKRWLAVKGLWGLTDEAFDHKLDTLRRHSFDAVALADLERIGLTVGFPTVDGLLLRLEQYRTRITTLQTFEGLVLHVPLARRVSLEEYLVTQTQFPVKPEVAVKRLSDVLAPCLQALQLMHSEDDVREGYYRRHLEPTLHDVDALLTAFTVLIGVDGPSTP